MEKINKIILLSLALLTNVALADAEQEAWYYSKDKEHLVKEMTKGQHYAMLSNSQGGEISVYIFMNDETCKTSDSTVVNHNPIYVNTKLVQYSQYCDGSRRYFFPTTKVGRAYVVEEFVKKGQVELKTHDGSATFLFSAKKFKEAHKVLKELEQAI